MSEKKTNFTQSWWVRRAAYVLVAVVGLVLTGLGYATQDQVDAFTASPLLGTVVGFVAAMFTHRGSDSTATGEDVRAAQAAAVGGGVDVGDLLARLRESVPTPNEVANSVLSAIRAEELGQHLGVSAGRTDGVGDYPASGGSVEAGTYPGGE